MDYPDEEVERVALGLIAEFGARAVKETKARAASARVSGGGFSAFVWERVLARVDRLLDDRHDKEFQEAC